MQTYFYNTVISLTIYYYFEVNLLLFSDVTIFHLKNIIKKDIYKQVLCYYL